MTRGRQVGWRKPDRKSVQVNFRITESAFKWLQDESEKTGISQGEILRQLIDDRRHT